MRCSLCPLLLGFFVAFFLVGPVQQRALADTYTDWKARVFSAAEQADPLISAEGANPAGDGISNLTKYALNLDPHRDGSASLPKVTSDGTSLLLTYRVPPYVTTDLRVVPEVSPDLQNWHRGPSAVRVYSSEDLPDGTLLRTVYAVSPQASNTRLFLRLQLIQGNALPDYWQRQYFGRTDVDPAADGDGDRITNLEEYLLDGDPNDVYSPDPVLTIIAGNHQGGAVNEFVPDALVVRVTNIHGLPLLNAPVRYVVASGGGQLSLTDDGQGLGPTLDTRTNASGQAQVRYKQGAAAPVTSTISVQAVNQGRVSAQSAFTASTANPPVITLLSPQPGSTSSTSQVTVSIRVTSEALLDEVRINSVLVAPGDNGLYSQTLTLPEGPQSISLRAKSVFGLVTFQRFSITVAAQAPNVTIRTPADQQVVEEANVYVRVQADTATASVTINGRPATRRGSTYAVWAPLTVGANTITANLTAADGRQGSDTVSVQFSPPAGWTPNGDDDGDGVPNSVDLFPEDRSNSTDPDNDGVGDHDDPDSDDPNVDDVLIIYSPEDGEVINAE